MIKFDAVVTDAKLKGGDIQMMEIKLQAKKTDDLWDFIGQFFDARVDVQLTGFTQGELGDTEEEKIEDGGETHE